MGWRVYCFGVFEVYQDNKCLPWKDFGGNKARQLLKILLTEPNTFFTRDQLINRLWNEKPPEDPRKTLRNYIWHLQRMFDDKAHQLIRSNQNRGYGFWSREDVWVDAHEFERHLKLTKGLLAKQNFDEAMQHLTEATALYRGEFLREDLYEDWAALPRSGLQEKYCHALVKLAELCARKEELAKAIEYCQEAVSLDPGNEGIHRELMQYLLLAGNRDKAIKVFQSSKKYLKEELKIEPDAQTIALYNSIIASGSTEEVHVEPKVEEAAVRSTSPAPTLAMRSRWLLRVGVWGGSLAVILLAAFWVWNAANPKPTAAFVANAGVQKAKTIAQALLAAVEPPEGMIAWWDGDTLTSNGAIAKDLVGKHDGALKGTVSLVDAVVGKGFRFAGGFTSMGAEGAFIVVPSSVDLDLVETATVEFWAKVEGLNSGNANFMITKGAMGTNGENSFTYALVMSDKGEISGYFDQEDGVNNSMDGLLVEGIGKFHHYAYVKNEENHLLYVDGKLIASAPRHSLPESSLNVELVIGGAKGNALAATGNGFCCNFSGIMDEVSLYSRALTPEEIKRIFDAGASGKKKPS